ncbi:MAG: J domain-containing protein [Azoarcus sp.]|jgi:hypothetical protein|nr:J domain-containing protein [Azoarcus sp.]
MTPWKILGIEPTGDEREIRRAYARQLKTRQHENDPDYFARLRQAYEWVLACAQQPVVQVQPVQMTENTPAEASSSLETEEKESNANANIIVSYSASYQINPVPDADVSPVTRDSFVHAAKAKKANDELENMLQEIDEIFTESLHLKPVRKKRKRLDRIWEQIRFHPRLDTLDGRELFSERIAFLLAKHWSGSRLIWQDARDFFGWQYPVPSDCSSMANSLRTLFQEEDKQEKSGTKSKVKSLIISDRKTAWRNMCIWMFVLFALVQVGQYFQQKRYVSTRETLPVLRYSPPALPKTLETLPKAPDDDAECLKECMNNKLHGYLPSSYVISEVCKCKQQDKNSSPLVLPKGHPNLSDTPRTSSQTRFPHQPRSRPAVPPP